MSLAVSIYISFILLTQSVKGAQFLNASYLFPLFGLSSACALIDIVLLASMDGSW